MSHHDSKPRRSNMPRSSVNAPPKKDGAGGSYTFGPSKDVTDYGHVPSTVLPKTSISSEPTPATDVKAPTDVAQAEFSMQPKEFPPVGAQAADAPPHALGAAAAPALAAQNEAAGSNGATKKGAIIGRIGNLLVYVETEARNVYEPVKVWLVETSGKMRAAIEARAEPVLQRLQVAGEPIVVYVKPLYAKVASGALTVKIAVSKRVICAKAKALQLKDDCGGKALAIYSTAYEGVDTRYKAACAIGAEKAAAFKAKGLELYKVAEGRALPYYTKANDIVQPCYLKVKDRVHYVETTVGGVVLKIKVGAGERASVVKNAVLARYTAIAEFIGSYTEPIAAKLAAMYQAVEDYISSNLSAILAKAKHGKAIAWTKACDVAVVVKVRSTAVKDWVMVYPNAVSVKVHDGFVFMKGIVDGKVVVVKAKLAHIANAVASCVLKVKDRAKLKAYSAMDTTHVKYLALQTKTKSLAADPNARVTAASAMGGATVMGASGGAVGLLTGGAVGAACGLPLSLFTFGLSVPMGAAIGGGAGLCAGAVTGGTAGFLGGGAAGHKIHQNKDSIAEGFSAAASKVNGIKGLAVDKASAYKNKVADSTAASAAYVRAKFAGGTGGTGEDK